MDKWMLPNMLSPCLVYWYAVNNTLFTERNVFCSGDPGSGSVTLTPRSSSISSRTWGHWPWPRVTRTEYFRKGMFLSVKRVFSTWTQPNHLMSEMVTNFEDLSCLCDTFIIDVIDFSVSCCKSQVSSFMYRRTKEKWKGRYLLHCRFYLSICEQ